MQSLIRQDSYLIKNLINRLNIFYYRIGTLIIFHRQNHKRKKLDLSTL